MNNRFEKADGAPVDLPDDDAGRMEKLARLESSLARMGKVAVAYSGGVDSAFLAAVCRKVLGNDATAVMVVSELLSTGEAEAAASMADQIGIRLETVTVDALDDPEFAANPVDHCYYCKRRVFGLCVKKAAEAGIPYVLDGRHTDDEDDYRPGTRAAIELGVISPLAGSGLSRADIEALSRDMFGLPGWNRGQGPCLASRFARGVPITRKGLDAVRAVEDLLKAAGVGYCRARNLGSIVKIETTAEGMAVLMSEDTRLAVVKAAVAAGFSTVTLDLEPYRRGRMNSPV